MNEFRVEEKDSGQRLDKYIARLLPLASRGFLYKALRNKDIRLNGKKAEGREMLIAGDTVLFRFPDVQFADLGGRKQERSDKAARDRISSDVCSARTGKKEAAASPGEASEQSKDNPLKEKKKTFPAQYGKIVYEDEDIILADKKRGVLSQKAKTGDESINEALLAYCGGRTETYTPSVCNRLDRNTSGLIVFAKTYRGAREMGTAIRERSAKKYYLAAVSGHVSDPGEERARLKKNEGENLVTVLPAGAEEGDLIETAYEPLAFFEKEGAAATLLKIDLRTGKTHQIRAHLSFLGMPVLGDPKYGHPGDGERFHVSGLMLHSYELMLPGRGTYRTEVPKEFRKLFPAYFQR